MAEIDVDTKDIDCPVEVEGEKCPVDVRGETCPVPLVETRKAIRKAEPGDLIIVKGDHPASVDEIPMAVDSLGMELVSVEEEGDEWTIQIKVK